MDRYSQILEKDSPEGKKMYKTVRYPEIPRTADDIYVFTTIGDRFDVLALEYYGDSSLWWIISIANDNLYQNSLTPPPGSQIRIPPNAAPIISEYKSINS
jgi:hypothetical protein